MSSPISEKSEVRSQKKKPSRLISDFWWETSDLGENENGGKSWHNPWILWSAFVAHGCAPLRLPRARESTRSWPTRVRLFHSWAACESRELKFLWNFSNWRADLETDFEEKTSWENFSRERAESWLKFLKLERWLLRTILNIFLDRALSWESGELIEISQKLGGELTFVNGELTFEKFYQVTMPVTIGYLNIITSIEHTLTHTHTHTRTHTHTHKQSWAPHNSQKSARLSNCTVLVL